MPALTVFHNRFHKFSTRPFAGDDLHILCILICLLRLIQFICLVPWMIYYFINKLNGLDIWINGVPYWCPQYEELKKSISTPLFAEEIAAFRNVHNELFVSQVSSFEDGTGPYIYGMIIAIVYFGINTSWLCMVWSAASIGTPTEPDGRDKYLRPLIIFQLFAGVCFPVILLAMGIHGVWYYRDDNFRCGSDVPPPDPPPDEFAHFHFFSILMITYALEVMFWPTIFVSKITRVLKKHDMFQKREGRRQRYRIECMMGLMLRCLQCLSCGKVGGKDFKNRGELKEFADQFMELLNFDTKLDIVLSDIYVGLHMLARAQLEANERAIQLAMKKSKFIRNLVTDKAHAAINDRTEDEDPFPSHPQHKMQRKSSIFVLEQRENSTYQVCERDLLLESNKEDKTTIQNLAHYSIYAQIIYSRLRLFAIENGWILNEEVQFSRALETIFESKYLLSGLDCDRAMLCYASFLNGIVSTPYAILVDKSKQKVVITIRGTISIEDMVIDLHYKPARLEKVGSICGTNLDGHCCHKGILARSKWLYNQIKETKVLKTLYSEKSPFKDYGLVVCGHSLGAGCASLLAIMIRPAFPSVRCYAYEPPGGLLDEELAKKSEDFIISVVRQDDMICRISHQNFDSLRDNFLDILTRIKVPKIVAFHDIRTPCTGAIKQRNAKVLRPRADVPTDTDFYKRLKQFRLERQAADYTKLYLPGKIVHFLDPGGGRPHIPYYASRSEFDFIAISKTMASDHSCINLVDVLRNKTRLSGGKEQSIASFANHNSIVLMEEKEEHDADDFRLFMLCLNPHGRLPILLVTCALLAVICSLASVTNCNFLRFSQTGHVNGQELFSISTTMGLFSYSLVECGLDGGNCTSLSDFVDSPFCVPYSAESMARNPWLVHSQIFFGTLMVFAFISLLLLSISTCYEIGRKTWAVISLMLLSSLLFQGLVFTVRNDESLCGTKEEQEGIITISNCYISQGAALAISACVLYFLAAVGSMYFAFRIRRKI